MKSVNIIYLKKTEEILNRKSALGAYIFCLGGLLAPHYKVYINNIPYEKLSQMHTDAVSILPKRNLIARILPAFAKSTLKLRKQLSVNNRNMEQLLKEANVPYDYIMEYYTLGSIVGVKMAEKTGAKLILVLDAPVLEEYVFFNGSALWYKKQIMSNEKISLHRSHKVICYSNPMKEYVLKQSGIAAERIYLHQNIDFSRFVFYSPRKSPNPGICFVGSFLKWHHADFLVKFAAEKKQEFPGLKIYMVGEGQQWSACKNLAASLQVNDMVIFTGYLDGEALENCKRQCQVGIMPGSNWYGAPNKIFEYGAAGMAVLAPSTPTILDLFPPEAGIVFFKNEDYHDFGEKLSALLREIIQGDQTRSNQLSHFIAQKYNAANTTLFYRDIFE